TGSGRARNDESDPSYGEDKQKQNRKRPCERRVRSHRTTAVVGYGSRSMNPVPPTEPDPLHLTEKGTTEADAVWPVAAHASSSRRSGTAKESAPLPGARTASCWPRVRGSMSISGMRPVRSK